MQHRLPFVLVVATPLALALPFALSQCSRSTAGATSVPDAACAVLFGNPNAQTGLGPDQCRPECACGASLFVPPAYSAAFIQSLLTDWQLATPYAPITVSPYVDAAAPPDDPDGTVCAVLPRGASEQTPRLYDLVTYPSTAAATAASAAVTHYGHCGVCSTLANLAVYMRENDLTAPVRACAESATDDAADVACLEQLGFDGPCAQAWAYDADNTRAACLNVCLASAGDGYNLDDGGLSPCIACDEDQSGPIFKAVAGRTRRNSGLPNAICRPCAQVQPLVHAY